MVCRYLHAECTHQHVAWVLAVQAPMQAPIVSCSTAACNLLYSGFCVWGVAFDLGHSTAIGSGTGRALLSAQHMNRYSSLMIQKQAPVDWKLVCVFLSVHHILSGHQIGW